MARGRPATFGYQPITSGSPLLFNFVHCPMSVPVALIAMTFPNEKNGMRVKPLLVSREAAQRSGGLPTLIPFR
jgi:hypothetical protein